MSFFINYRLKNLQEDEVKALTSSVSADGKTAVACIHFLLNNAARHNASELVFNEEIQQLGLPKEHAAAMCSVLTEHATAIRQRLIDKSFKSKLLIVVLCFNKKYSRFFFLITLKYYF